MRIITNVEIYFLYSTYLLRRERCTFVFFKSRSLICDTQFVSSFQLYDAAFHGHEKVIKLLITSNANLLNAQDSSGSSPLHEAMKHGNLNAAKYIIRSGADVSLVDNVGQTILHVAALTGNVEAVEYILEHCLIDINCEASFEITPLILARKNNHGDVVNILLKHGAKE